MPNQPTPSTACYKYRPLYQIAPDGKRVPHPHTESIFTKASLYYAAPSSLNDPFDCNLKLHLDGTTKQEWESYCDALVLDRPHQREEILRMKHENRWCNDPQFKKAIADKHNALIYNGSSVYCLSAKANSIPMFSYYADGHQGIAIELQIREDDVPCGLEFSDRNEQGVGYGGKMIPGKVVYTDTIPELNYLRLRGTPALVHNLILTKHHEWRHEEEIRIFRHGVPASPITFTRQLLTKVILGCRTEPEDIVLVSGWLNNWPSPVTLARAEPSSDRFELNITDIGVIGRQQG